VVEATMIDKPGIRPVIDRVGKGVQKLPLVSCYR
jgi:hypothetical protein